MKSVFYFKSSQSPDQLFKAQPDQPGYVRLVLPRVFAHRMALWQLARVLGP